jgi:hypothetical protein
MQPPDAPHSEPKTSQSLSFRAVRLLALYSVFSIIIPWYITILHEPSMEKSDLLIPLCFAPLWGPYLWIFLRLNSTADSLVRKKALALAVSWGVLGFLLFSAISLLIASSAGFPSNDWEPQVVFGCLSLVQLSLIAASIKAYLSMTSERRDRRILLWRLGIAGCIALGFFLATPLIQLEKPASLEAGAVASLRNVNTAQSLYAREHPDKGFAASLLELGPSPGAEFIDGLLASGKKGGYIITLYPAPPDSAGRRNKYTLVARPLHYGKDETRSFLTDESGVFHATQENRVPTVQDPVL